MIGEAMRAVALYACVLMALIGLAYVLFYAPILVTCSKGSL